MKSREELYNSSQLFICSYDQGVGVLVSVGVGVGVFVSVAEAVGVFVRAVGVGVPVRGGIGVNVAVDVADVTVALTVAGVKVAVVVIVATGEGVAVGAQDCKVSSTSVHVSSKQTFKVMVVFSSARQSTSFVSLNLSIVRHPRRPRLLSSSPSPLSFSSSLSPLLREDANSSGEVTLNFAFFGITN